MEQIKKVVFTTFLFVCFLGAWQTAFAVVDYDIAINPESLRFSTNTILEGNAVRIYAKVVNVSRQDLRGTVQFYDDSANAQIGSDQTVSVLAGSSDDIFVDWYPYFEGTHQITVTIDPWLSQKDDPSNNWAKISTNVLKDSDHDGIIDEEDDDNDNDGFLNEDDAFPLDAKEQFDTDGDRIGDNEDEDDDNDSHLDPDDAFPLNSLEWDDTDQDGIGNNKDEDDDDDGLSDKDEDRKGSDPLNRDSDEDGVIDGDDAFVMDASEQYDYDNDGKGDNVDEDDDDDGVLDEDDPDDHNKGPIIELGGNTLFAFLNREAKIDAYGSYDEDGNLSYIKWTIDDEIVQTGREFKHTFTNKGLQKIKIVIIDDKNESREKIIEINVIDLDYYLIISLILIIILLAIIINVKYSSWAKKLITKLKNKRS